MTRVEEMNTMVAIVERAEKLGICRDRLTLLIDLDKAHQQFDLRLEEMLAAEDFDFAHDVRGIQNNIDRSVGVVVNFFVPRFARSE